MHTVGFTYELRLEDGQPADPPTFTTSEPRWKVGDTFMTAGGRVWRILEIRSLLDESATADAVWTVESFPG